MEVTLPEVMIDVILCGGYIRVNKVNKINIYSKGQKEQRTQVVSEDD